MRRFLSKNISNEFFLGLILFTLPISININSIIIIIAISFFLYKNIKENSCINLKFFLPSFLFFLIQILSFYLSTNYDESVKKLTLFLPFLLFPLCFSPYLKDKNINVFRLFNYLLFGVIFIVIYGGFRFVFDIIFLNEKYNYGHGINLFMKYVPHHVYLSIFILISIVFTALGVVKNKLNKYHLAILPILYLMLFLLTSRIAILIAVFILPIILFKILKIKYQKKKLILSLLGLLFCISVIGFSIQFTRDKILFTYYELAEITTKREPFYGIKLREQIWESSFDEIKGRPWGSGIGDVQADLNLRYNFNGFTKINDMNAHNQYLQFLLTYGVVFTGIILLTISRLLIGIIRKKEFLLLYSWGVLLLFSVSESILQRQWGVIIFAFILNFSIFRLNKSK